MRGMVLPLFAKDKPADRRSRQQASMVFYSLMPTLIMPRFRFISSSLLLEELPLLLPALVLLLLVLLLSVFVVLFVLLVGEVVWLPLSAWFASFFGCVTCGFCCTGLEREGAWFKDCLVPVLRVFFRVPAPWE